jgi:hypothetical protein
MKCQIHSECWLNQFENLLFPAEKRPKSAEKFPNPWEKFPLLGHPNTVSTQNKASITLSSFLLDRVATARIEKFIQNSAFGDFVWVRPQKLAGEANRSFPVDYTSSITNLFGDLGKFLELWLEGLPGFAGNPLPNDSVSSYGLF